MVHVLYTVEMVEVQEHNLSGMRRQETADLLEAFSDLKEKRNNEPYMYRYLGSWY